MVPRLSLKLLNRFGLSLKKSVLETRINAQQILFKLKKLINTIFGLKDRISNVVLFIFENQGCGVHLGRNLKVGVQGAHKKLQLEC